jgi:AraC-like DNA-binding protein
VALRYVEQSAPPAIAAAVECVWTASDLRPRASRPPDRLLPDGCPELIVHTAGCYARRIGGRVVTQPAAFLAGTLSQPWIVQAPPRFATLGVRFRPGGLTALFGVSVDGTADREVRLRELPRAVAALVAAVRAARGPAAMRRAAEAWLVAWVAARPGGLAAPACAAAVRVVHRRRGRIGVEALAAAVGLGRRRLERLFRRETALSPKQYIRIVRLNVLLRALDAPGRDALVDLAIDAGYFDQAHMARDFKALTARRASARRADDGELAVHLTRPARLALLLDPDR